MHVYNRPIVHKSHAIERTMRWTSLFTQMLVCTAAMAAAPIDGTYSRVFGGYVYVPPNMNRSFDSYTINSPTYQGGFEAGGAFGYKSNPMRYEAEITYLKANIEHFYLTNVQETTTGGYNQAVLGMANVYYDFLSSNPILQPFIGAGIGYGWIQSRFNGTSPIDTGTINASNSTFAYQATAGITYNFSENYALDLSYRYIGTSNLSSFGEMFQVHMINASAIYRFDGNKYQ